MSVGAEQGPSHSGYPWHGKDLSLEEAEEIEFFSQRIECAWLLDVLVGAGIHRRTNIITFRICCHHDEWKRVIDVQFANCADEIDTAHHRHVPIDQHQIGRGHLLQTFQGLATVSRLNDLNVHLSQILTKDHSNGLRIFYDKSPHNVSFLCQSCRSRPYERAYAYARRPKLMGRRPYRK